MKIPADVLQRKGYRLPTEAEWEYACRAGAMTSRYYGLSVDLLEQYAWYQANSQDRAWPCGSLLPNDLGLFDMLGNVYEWCQDRETSLPAGEDSSTHDKMMTSNEDPRLLRGGTFTLLRRTSARRSVPGARRRTAIWPALASAQ